MSEIEAVTAARNAGQNIIDLLDQLESAFSEARNSVYTMLEGISLAEAAWCNDSIGEEASCDENEVASDSEEPRPTFEELRGLLAEKSRLGFRDAVKSLLSEHGASRLSELAEDRYAAVAKAAREICNA